MAKKYLSLEEAADQLGLTTEALQRAREKGELRGFADRGAWKFKAEDIEEFGRSRQADSNPEVPLIDSDSGPNAGEDPLDDWETRGVTDSDALPEGGEPQSVGDWQTRTDAGDQPDEAFAESALFGEGGEGSDGSSVLGMEQDDVGEQPTEISSGQGEDSSVPIPPPEIGTSDSDVRLILDKDLSEGSDPDVDVPVPEMSDSDSDSDVRLVNEKKDDSDSDVKLVGSDSDSDVRLAPDAAVTGPGSDSDVKLIGDTEPQIDGGSDSDVRLVGAGTDPEVPLTPDDSGIPVGLEETALDDSEDDGTHVLSGGSDVVSEKATLKSGSGIGLENIDDSGIALESADSGLTLEAGDSGIALEAVDDSGISLADVGDDSGISLSGDIDDEMNQTVPLMDAADSDNELGGTAQMEIPNIEDDSEFELEMMQDEPEQDDTNVLFLDADGDDEHAETMVKSADEDVFEEFEAVDEDAFEVEEVDEFDGGEAFDDLEVAADVFGDDDEVDDLDVFDAADADFAPAYMAGESQIDFVPPPDGTVVVAAEPEWGVGTFLGLLATTGLMLLLGLMMIDLARGLWAYEEPHTSFLLETIGGLF